VGSCALNAIAEASTGDDGFQGNPSQIANRRFRIDVRELRRLTRIGCCQDVANRESDGVEERSQEAGLVVAVTRARAECQTRRLNSLDSVDVTHIADVVADESLKSFRLGGLVVGKRVVGQILSEKPDLGMDGIAPR